MADVTQPKAVATMVDAAVKEFSSVDIAMAMPGCAADRSCR
jgi:NADP-dependent 3-hydroxy acid dehydrogenase YdfG